MTPPIYDIVNVFAQLCPEWWKGRRECLKLNSNNINVMLDNGCVVHFHLISIFNNSPKYELWFEPINELT